MTSQELLEVIGETQDEYILDAKAPHRKHAPMWIKWVAAAACLCLILGTVLFPPAILYPNAAYSAQDIADLFFGALDNGYTNAYTKVYVPSNEFLQLNPIPDAEFLPIYRYNNRFTISSSRIQMGAYIKRTLSNYCSALGVPVPDYEFSDDKSFWTATTQGNCYDFYGSNGRLWNMFAVSVPLKTDDPTIRLNGNAVQVDQRQTDQEILASLEKVKCQLFEIYGVTFSDAKINRHYSAYNLHGIDRLSVYYFDADAHPLNTASEQPVSDYIHIRFENLKNYEGDCVSDTILCSADIEYWNCTLPAIHLYPQIAKAKMISLAEAEALLYKGYVFGGHFCDLCMAAQEMIRFEDYDSVSFEYMFSSTAGGKSGDVIPFYAFYKAIGTSDNGNTIYAKTYVPAIEVSDMDAYFQEQQQYHKG